jgi:hypothetical protein
MGSRCFIYSLALFGFCWATANAIESVADNGYNTFGGVNYKQSLIRATNEWDQLFVKTQPGFDIYLGWRFHPNFSAEFGYEWSADKALTTTVNNGNRGIVNGNPGESLLGLTNNSLFPIELVGKVRFKTGHVDFNTFIPFVFQDWAPEWIVSVGIGAMKPSMKITGTAIGFNGNNGAIAPGIPGIPGQFGAPIAQNFISQFSRIEGRSRAVFRGGFGLQASLIEDVGIRALVRYERTSVLRGRGTIVVEDIATEKIFQNGFSLSLGLYFKF